MLCTCGVATAEELAFRRHVLNADSTYSACAVIDVNHDGKLDVVSGGWWYEAPDWKRHQVREVEFIRGRYDGYSELPLDVNGDGWTDLVSVNYRSRKLAWLEHPGPSLGTWTEHVVALPGPMETGRLADVDGDGRLDVLPNGVGFAAWWEVSGKGEDVTWKRHDLPAAVSAHGVGFGDINGDGRGDIVSPRGWLEAPEDRRGGAWVWHPDWTLHRDCSVPMFVFDVDDDGDNDIVYARGHNFGLYWVEQVRAEGKRKWVRHAIDTSVSQYHSPLLADLDNDGRVEVIGGKRFMAHDGRDPGAFEPLMICRYQYDPAKRTWRRGVISAGGGAGFGLDPKVIDLDGDGDLDLVGPGRSGLFWHENLLIGKSAAPASIARRPVPTYDDHAELLVYKDDDGRARPVRTPLDWGRRRAHILANMERVMGPLPGPSRRVPLDVRVIEQTQTPSYLRKRITFAAEPGNRVPAFLLIPNELKGRAPAMLCLHSTVRIGKEQVVGLGGEPSRHYAHELANRGYVCLAPDYPSFGDYDYDFNAPGEPYVSGTMKAIWNNIRAIDLLESLPEVHPDRIGCIGHSLGGHNTMFSAAFDRRIRAMVSSCGFTAFGDYYGGKLKGWTSDRYMPRIRDEYGNDPDRMPFDFHEVVAAFAPRPFFVNAPLHDSNFDVGGVRKVIASAQKVYALRGAAKNLKVMYPDAQHDFPEDVREAAYAWLNANLKP